MQKSQGDEGLQGNALPDIIAKLKYDPSDFGMSCRIPLNVYQPLLELGLTDFNDLLNDPLWEETSVCQL